MKLQKRPNQRTSPSKKPMSREVGKITPLTPKKWNSLTKKEKIAIMGLI